MAGAGRGNGRGPPRRYGATNNNDDRNANQFIYNNREFDNNHAQYEDLDHDAAIDLSSRRREHLIASVDTTRGDRVIAGQIAKGAVVHVKPYGNESRHAETRGWQAYADDQEATEDDIAHGQIHRINRGTVKVPQPSGPTPPRNFPYQHGKDMSYPEQQDHQDESRTSSRGRTAQSSWPETSRPKTRKTTLPVDLRTYSGPSLLPDNQANSAYLSDPSGGSKLHQRVQPAGARNFEATGFPAGFHNAPGPILQSQDARFQNRPNEPNRGRSQFRPPDENSFGIPPSRGSRSYAPPPPRLSQRSSFDQHPSSRRNFDARGPIPKRNNRPTAPHPASPPNGYQGTLASPNEFLDVVTDLHGLPKIHRMVPETTSQTKPEVSVAKPDASQIKSKEATQEKLKEATQETPREAPHARPREAPQAKRADRPVTPPGQPEQQKLPPNEPEKLITFGSPIKMGTTLKSGMNHSKWQVDTKKAPEEGTQGRDRSEEEAMIGLIMEVIRSRQAPHLLDGENKVPTQQPEGDLMDFDDKSEPMKPVQPSQVEEAGSQTEESPAGIHQTSLLIALAITIAILGYSVAK